MKGEVDKAEDSTGLQVNSEFDASLSTKTYKIAEALHTLTPAVAKAWKKSILNKSRPRIWAQRYERGHVRDTYKPGSKVSIQGKASGRNNVHAIVESLFYW